MGRVDKYGGEGLVGDEAGVVVAQRRRFDGDAFVVEDGDAVV